MTGRPAVLSFALACLATAFAVTPARAERVAIAARTFDGQRFHETAVVLVVGSRVAALDAPRMGDATLIDIPGSVLTPGLLDLDTAFGSRDAAGEEGEAVSPDLRVVDAFNPDPFEEAAFRSSGITTAWISAARTSVLGGAGALVQPGAGWMILHPAWGASASLSAAARVPDRAPTSLPGQAGALTEGLARMPAHGAPGTVRIRVDDAASARLALKVRGAILVGAPPGAENPELEAARSVVVSGLGPASSTTQIDAVVKLQDAGVRVAFGSGENPAGPRSVRAAAARAVLRGLPPERALAALTGDAAEIARLPDGRGTIAPGAVADLVLWSGDPVSLTSRPLRVWVAGTEVYRAR